MTAGPSKPVGPKRSQGLWIKASGFRLRLQDLEFS